MKFLHNYFILFALCSVAFFSCERETLTLLAVETEEANTMEAEADRYHAELQTRLADVEKEVSTFPKSAPVSVPAGSVDALAAAIQAAGPGGTVILESGLHTESASVIIPHRLRLRGEDGAILEVTTGVHNFATTSLDPAIHILNARRTIIQGVEIRPTGTAGGVGILVEDSPRTIISHNQILDHQFGVILEASKSVYILDNELTGTPLWQTNEAPFATGILTMKGDNAIVSKNETSGFFIGIWACSRYGWVVSNESSGNFLGFVLCTATPGGWKLPSGELSGSDFSAFRTRVFFNYSHDNLDVNYQTIDGANNNFLAVNRATNAGRVDYEFAQETDRYSLGFLLPETFDNRALISGGDTYVDCGRDNQIFGGTALAADENNCF